MRRDDICFEQYAKTHGYDIRKNEWGSYLDPVTEKLHRGFAPGFLAGIKEALRAVGQLEEETEP